MPAAKFHTRKGYLVSTADNSGTSVTDVGHVFGRLGEGNGNYPGVAKPFYWGTPVTGTDKSAIMISLFPETYDDAGLDSTAKEIVVEGKAYEWEAVTSFDSPTQPAATTEAKVGAYGLAAASFIAIASVASSLY